MVVFAKRRGGMPVSSQCGGSSWKVGWGRGFHQLAPPYEELTPEQAPSKLGGGRIRGEQKSDGFEPSNQRINSSSISALR